MKTKVTVQDIADALQLSRITVSKALNNSPKVSAATRELVLKKAREMNYKSLSYLVNTESASGSLSAKYFAFVMHAQPTPFHIGTVIMTQLEREIRVMGYSLILYTVTEEDISSMTLPANLKHNQVEAIICLEMFHPEYSRLICSLGKPVLFIDACADFYSLKLPCDLLLMESRSSVFQMISVLCRRHQLTTAGFVGDIRHCLSFRERYEGFLLAAMQCNLSTGPYAVIADDPRYGEAGWLLRQLQKMPELPDLFVCANDGLAQILIQSLTELGCQIPQDILVCGFDGTHSLIPGMNGLTTVCTPSKELGTCAAHLLFQRIQDPGKIASSTYLGTEILFRDASF